jgi:hypothetical protein
MGLRMWFLTVLLLMAFLAVGFPVESDDRTGPSVPEDLAKLEDLLPKPAPVLEQLSLAYGFRGSPRGDEIAFFRRPTANGPGAERAAHGEYALFVSDPTGEHARAVSKAVLDEFAPPPAWSADGLLLAYVYDEHVHPAHDAEQWYWAARLAITTREGKSDRVIFHQDQGLFKSVSWSPDGGLLAVGFAPGGIHSRRKDPKIYFLTPAGDEVFHIDLPNHDMGSADVMQAAWSPDGGRLAVATQETMLILDVKTRRIRRLASLHLWPEVPQWSADGGSLAIVSNRILLVIDSASGVKRTIPFQGGVRAAVWVPGHRVLMVVEEREAYDLVDLALLAIGGGHSPRPAAYRYTPYFVSTSSDERRPLTQYARISRGDIPFWQLRQVGEALIWWSRG